MCHGRASLIYHGYKSSQSWILLAHYRSRLLGPCQEVQAMPEARQPYSSETRATTPHTIPMAIR